MTQNFPGKLFHKLQKILMSSFPDSQTHDAHTEYRTKEVTKQNKKVFRKSVYIYRTVQMPKVWSQQTETLYVHRESVSLENCSSEFSEAYETTF